MLPSHVTSTMPYDALCYLITSCAGDLIAQCGCAHYARPCDVLTLCRLLAYHSSALDGKHVFVVELHNLSLVVHPSEAFITAAVISPNVNVAEAAFETHLLAVLFQLGTLKSGSVQLCSSNTVSVQPSGGSSNSHIDLQRLRTYKASALKGLSLVLRTPGICLVELVKFDMHGNWFQITSLPADSCFVNSQTPTFLLIWPAIEMACRSLQNVMLADLRSTFVNSQRTTSQQLGKGLKTTFSAVYMDSEQQALRPAVVMKCLHVLDLCMFLLAWSDAPLLKFNAQQRLARPHIKMGKAAVPPIMRFQLNVAATIIKERLNG